MRDSQQSVGWTGESRGGGETTATAVGSPPDPIYIFAATPLQIAASQHPVSTANALLGAAGDTAGGPPEL